MSVFQLQVRRGTAAAWTTANSTLAQGEIGYETDTGKIKIGTGALTWTALGYYGTVASFQGRIGAVTLTKADVTGTGLTYSDVGADAFGAASTAQAAAIASALSTAMQKSANGSDIVSPSTFRTNLGLGTLATTSPTGTADSTHFLNGAGAWAVPPGSGGGVAGSGFTMVDTAKTTAFTAAANTGYDIDLTTGSVTVTLEATPADATWNWFGISAFGAGHVFTVTAGTGDTLQFTTTLSHAAGEAVWIQYDASTKIWRIIADRTPLSMLALLASPAFTGTPTSTTATAGDNSTKIATTAYADSAVAVEASRATTAEALKAPLASPALTGNPTVPTQTPLMNNTRAASTAYVDSAVAALPGTLPTIVTTGALSDATGVGTIAQSFDGQIIAISWDGTTAKTNSGATITTRPGGTNTNIRLLIVGGPAATPPSFWQTGDLYLPTS